MGDSFDRCSWARDLWSNFAINPTPASRCSAVAGYRGRWADRTDHEVTDATRANGMAVTLTPLRDTGACHVRSRALGYGRMYERFAKDLGGGV